MPVAVHALYGRDFLPFTEQPGVIWGTTSASEALRLMGYWTSYIGVGYGGSLRPFTSDAGVMLFHPAVVVASLLVPALVAAGLLVARRWAFAPFFLVLLLGGALIVMAGFPDGTPLRRAALGVYFHLPFTQFLRTTYKAAPLIVIAFALLAAAAAPAVWAHRLRLPAVAAGVVILALAVVAARPRPGDRPAARLGRDPRRVDRGGARTSTPSCPRTRAPSSSPRSSSASTTGPRPSTRSCPR